MSPARIVPAAAVALAELQPLAEAIFGGGPRPPGWFVRKLAREVVDPARSAVALDAGDVPIGYMLVGGEPRDRVAHSAGLGVLATWRGRGLGAALALAVLEPLRRAGLERLRVLAEPPRRGFYERLGFHAGAERHTLVAAGTGAAELELREHPPGAWALPGRQIAGWREGTWSRTPSVDAATLTLLGGEAHVHVSREGRALLVQRLCVADDDDDASSESRVHAALHELRGRVHRDTAVLLYGCDVVSCVTASLMRARWRVAQTACEMERVLGEGVDKHAAPTA